MSTTPNQAGKTRNQPRAQGGKFAPKGTAANPRPLIVHTDALQSAIELSQNPEALRLAGELATKCSECNVLTSTLTNAQNRLIAVEDKLTIASVQLRHSQEECRNLTARIDELGNERHQMIVNIDDVREVLGTGPRQHITDRAQEICLEVEALRKDNNTLAISLASAQSALKLASTSVDVYRRDLGSVETTCETLEAEVSRLQDAALRSREELLAAEAALCLSVAEAQRLQPLLPLWARTLFAFTLLAIVAAVAHRMGFVAGYEVTK